MATAVVLGIALGLASAFLRVGGPYGGSVLAILLVALSLVLQEQALRRLMHLMGQMLCWVQIIHMDAWIVKNEAGTEGSAEMLVDVKSLSKSVGWEFHCPAILEYSIMVLDKTLPVV